MDIVQQAFQQALAAREKAYCPYSKFKVGAAVKAEGQERIYAGCNVENSSYGATICAERNAVLQMVSQVGEAKLEFVLLITDSANFDTPCGMCLQVISEFAQPETPVYLCNLAGVQKTAPFKELFPSPFDKSSLNM